MERGPEDWQNVGSLAEIKDLLRDVFCQSNDNMAKNIAYRSDVFKISVEGDVGEQVRRLEVVVQRGLPDAVDKKNNFKASYKILHWKLI